MQNLHSTAAHQHLANVVSAWNGSCARKPPRKIADLIEKEGTRKEKEKKKKWLPVLENWMDSCSYRLSLLACVTSVLSVCVTSVYMRVLGCPTVSVAKIVFGVAMYWCHFPSSSPTLFCCFFLKWFGGRRLLLDGDASIAFALWCWLGCLPQWCVRIPCAALSPLLRTLKLPYHATRFLLFTTVPSLRWVSVCNVRTSA